MSYLLDAAHRGGILDEVRLRLDVTRDLHRDADGCAAVLDELLAMAAPRGPRKVWVGTARHHTGQYRKVVDVLTHRGSPVELLALGDFVYPDKGRERNTSWKTDIPLPEPFWTAMSCLRELVVHGDNLWMAGIRSSTLHRLAVRCTALNPKCVAAVGLAELPALTELELWIGDYYDQWDGTVADLETLLAADGLPALRHLKVCADIADDLAAALADAPLLRRLTTLDLSTSTLTDQGARSIAANRAAFAHLAWLNLDGNLLSDTGRSLVADVSRTVYVGDQREEPATDDDEPEAELDWRPTVLDWRGRPWTP
ncbi:MAG TPA: hypothetical protein VFV66_26030 [Nonomuraea sp.]|nr:hypothetical protein [Nonomuraea sp.]